MPSDVPRTAFLSHQDQLPLKSGLPRFNNLSHCCSNEPQNAVSLATNVRQSPRVHPLAHQGHVALVRLQLVHNMLQLPAPVHLHTRPLRTSSSTVPVACCAMEGHRWQPRQKRTVCMHNREVPTAVQAARGSRTRAMALLQVKCSSAFP